MINDLILNSDQFDPRENWLNPIPEEQIDEEFISSIRVVSLFDQNGYRLSPLEELYSKYNSDVPLTMYRGDEPSIHKKWFSQPEKKTGYVLNHSMLLERKGYDGAALEQLKKWCKNNNLVNKLIKYRTKWGIDLSIDYVDEDNVFEVFHYEYDSFDFQKILEVKKKVEEIVLKTDFDNVATQFIERKDEWVNLPFFEQSNWRCRFYGLEDENFKMVTWA